MGSLVVDAEAILEVHVIYGFLRRDGYTGRNFKGSVSVTAQGEVLWWQSEVKQT